MKLAKGTSVYIGRKKFTGEIPDSLAPPHLLKAEKDNQKTTPKKTEAPVKDKG